MGWKRNLERCLDAPKVVFAWVRSFARNEWKIEDYPLRYRHFDNSGYEGPARLRPVDWSVRVLRWTAMQGSGASGEQALQNLRENFARFKDRGEQPPRPGKYKEIELASQNEIERFAAIEQDFVAHILDVEWAWLSDESSLWDFNQGDTLDELYSRIKVRYGIDVSDIEGAKLLTIFSRLDQVKP